MIDWDRVSELRDEIGEDSFAEVLCLFLDESEEVIQRLTSSGTAKELENDLHFLKGSFLNLGFAAAAALCETGERRASQGDKSTDLDEIRAVYYASKTALTVPDAEQTALSA